MRYQWFKSQFHYGSIKTYTVEANKKKHLSLNSTMVRLKLRYQWFNNKNTFGLNSTMVRLKLIRLNDQNQYTPVSIPLWFD